MVKEGKWKLRVFKRDRSDSRVGGQVGSREFKGGQMEPFTKGSTRVAM